MLCTKKIMKSLHYSKKPMNCGALRHCVVSQSIIQSINQSTNQSTNQSINQPINQPINQSTNQPINPLISLFTNKVHIPDSL